MSDKQESELEWEEDGVRYRRIIGFPIRNKDVDLSSLMDFEPIPEAHDRIREARDAWDDNIARKDQ